MTQDACEPAPERRFLPSRAPARTCLTLGCARAARKRGRCCGRCTTRQWRARHKDALAERERARVFSDERQAVRRALGYLSSYLRRGIVQREPCGACGRAGLPHQPNPAKPLDVVWLCRDHRQAVRERALEALADARAAAEREAKHAAYRSERERFLDAWPLLPPDKREAIRGEVRRHPWGRGISEESPLWTQLATRAFHTFKTSKKF